MTPASPHAKEFPVMSETRSPGRHPVRNGPVQACATVWHTVHERTTSAAGSRLCKNNAPRDGFLRLMR
jgi:hypothetical protein